MTKSKSQVFYNLVMNKISKVDHYHLGAYSGN